ncbi:MAG: metal-sulfur cluster assembly factor [Sulfuritalea sp.]|nr:metal-sulfur cluster assembly factor [Sulfuritalea sp.]
MKNTSVSTPPDEAAIRDILRQVIDPEVGMNIVDLGLVYRVEATPARVLVEMTMTSPACPLGDMIIENIRDVLAPSLPARRSRRPRLCPSCQPPYCWLRVLKSCVGWWRHSP